MKPFVFVYQAVLDARLAEEEASKRSIGRIVARRSGLEQSLVEHRGFLETNRELARSSLVGRIDIETLRAHAGQSVQVLRRIRSLLSEMSEVHGALEAARAEWTECRHRRRAIECLRDRAKQDWEREQRRRERREQDDLTSTRASREVHA